MPLDDQDPVAAPPGGMPSPVPGPAPTPGLVKRLYREESAAWRAHYRRYFKIAARALGLGFVAGFVFFTLWPAREKKALEFVVKSLEDISLEGSALMLALTLFYHNARASIVAVAAGVIPFLFLPVLDPVLNGGVLGLLASVSKHQGLDVLRLFLTQILPHGVFELTAVLYVTSLGMYLSAGMGKKAVAAWRKRRARRAAAVAPDAGSAPAAPLEFLETYPDRTTDPTESLARNVARSFVLIVLPLLFISAAIEGFITPLLR